jgi:hypothetical protein
MKKTAKAERAESKASDKLFTYQVGGAVKTLEQMLQVQTKCGETRYVLMDKSRGEPAGTLVDKLDLMRSVMSIEAEEATAVRKRQQEGHRYDSKADRQVSLR